MRQWGLNFIKKGGLFIVLGSLAILCLSFEGLSYRHSDLPDSISLYVLEVDPQKCLMTPVHAYQHAMGRQTVKAMAEEHHALAAVNGGFFKMKPWEGLPAGILKIQHQWLSWPSKPRGAIGWSKNGDVVLLDQLLCSGSLKAQERVFTLDGLNRPPKKEEIIIFTPAFHSTTLTSSYGFEVIIQQNQFIKLREEGNSLIPPDGYVISFGSKRHLAFWKTIKNETPLDLKIQISPRLFPSLAKEWNHLPHIVGGTPLLVHQGQVITDFSSEQTLKTFIDRRHARTAVGVLSNGHWLFVVVEGHQWSINRGMTIPELAQLMVNLGCIEALNLDGGGSSTMFYDGKVVNHPLGDEDEGLGLLTLRPVSDAILIKEK